jgi:hypothetical protein
MKTIETKARDGEPEIRASDEVLWEFHKKTTARLVAIRSFSKLEQEVEIANTEAYRLSLGEDGSLWVIQYVSEVSKLGNPRTVVWLDLDGDEMETDEYDLANWDEDDVPKLRQVRLEMFTPDGHDTTTCVAVAPARLLKKNARNDDAVSAN